MPDKDYGILRLKEPTQCHLWTKKTSLRMTSISM